MPGLKLYACSFYAINSAESDKTLKDEGETP